MKILFAVNSWDVAAKHGFHQVIRDTWGGDVTPADLRFFMPRVSDQRSLPDEVFVDVSRDYDCICREVQEVLRWSVREGYDFTILLSTDSFLIPQKVLACGFEKYDYSGDFAFNETVPFGEVMGDTVNCTFNTQEGYRVHRHLYNWAGAGPARILSRKATAVVAERTKEAEYWYAADDIMIGQILGPLIKKGEITAWRIPNYNGEMVWHYKNYPENQNTPYSPSTGWMQRMYTEHRT
jgi:hypothetical protein